MPDKSASVQLSPIIPGTVQDAMQLSRQLGLEGILAKRIDSTYQAGRRSAKWTKVKHAKTQEVVVGGWRDGKGTREGTVGSVLVGNPDSSGKLIYP